MPTPLGAKRVHSQRNRRSPAQALAYGAAVAVAWVALLSAGASELSPLSRSPKQAVPALAEATVVQPAPPPVRDGRRELVSLDAGGGGRGAPEGASQPFRLEGGSDGEAGSQRTTSHPSVSPPSTPEPEPSGALGAGVTPGSSAKPVETAPPASPPSQAPAAPAAPTASPPSNPGAGAGPPETSHAPEGAGPPAEPGPPEHSGPPEGSSAPEHAALGKP